VADCVADARYAAVERLTVAGLTVNWPVTNIGTFMFGPQERHAFTAFMQESITNVIRHARASHVDVSIEVRDGDLQCRIADNGRGFAPDPQRRGDGLPNLVARAQTLAGRATISQRTDGVRGTEVTLTAPLGAYMETR
jgi:signal transduction histidine kinase